MSQNFASVSAVLNKVLQEPLADLINRSNPVLSALTKKGVSSQEIYLKARSASDHEAGAIADGSTVTVTAPKSSYINPTLPWATYISKFSVPKRLMDQVASNPGELGMLLMTEIQEAAKDLSSSIAADIFAGNVTNGLVGLQSIVDDANTYAGINRATAGNENWQSVVVDALDVTPQELSTALLYEVESDYFLANGYGWDTEPGKFTGVTSAAIFNKYRALMEDIDLSSLATAHFVNQANATGQLGYGKIGFMGVPFMRDRNMVAGAGDEADTSRIYFLDMSKIHLCTLTPNPAMAAVHQVQGYTSAPVVDGIQGKVEILGNAGEFVAGYVKAYVQLATDNPKAAGAVLKNVAAV